MRFNKEDGMKFEAFQKHIDEDEEDRCGVHPLIVISLILLCVVTVELLSLLIVLS